MYPATQQKDNFNKLSLNRNFDKAIVVTNKDININDLYRKLSDAIGKK